MSRGLIYWCFIALLSKIFVVENFKSVFYGNILKASISGRVRGIGCVSFIYVYLRFFEYLNQGYILKSYSCTSVYYHKVRIQHV